MKSKNSRKKRRKIRHDASRTEKLPLLVVRKLVAHWSKVKLVIICHTPSAPNIWRWAKKKRAHTLTSKQIDGILRVTLHFSVFFCHVSDFIYTVSDLLHSLFAFISCFTFVTVAKEFNPINIDESKLNQNLNDNRATLFNYKKNIFFVWKHVVCLYEHFPCHRYLYLLTSYKI